MPINSFDTYPMSWRPNKADLKRPVYLSLASLLEQDITNGFLAPGTKLPPQRELADFLDINFTTITRSYKICERKGLIYAITGSGTFVSPNAFGSSTISTDRIPRECIDLGFMSSFEQTNDIVAEVTRKVVQKGYLEKLLTYGDPTGIPHQKKAGLNWMEGFGIHSDTEHMAIASGSLNALTIAAIALFEPGNRIATDLYTFSNFIELAKMLHIQLVPIQGDAHGMLPDELESQCRIMDIHGIYLMPSCCNPTSIMISDARKHELADVIRKYNLILLEDDYHAFLTVGIIPDYKQPMFHLLPENTVYICATTKSICSGLRIAYMVYGDAFRKKILQAMFNINVKTSSLEAEIITELILSGKASDIVSKKKQFAQTANAIYQEFFPDYNTTTHPLSFHRWLPLEKNYDATQLELHLEHMGIHIFHSNRFLSGKTSSEQYLRVVHASTSSLDDLGTGLEILKRSLKEY